MGKQDIEWSFGGIFSGLFLEGEESRIAEIP